MLQPICAGCQGDGKAACKNCLLVLYCGRDCQTKHWPVHKRDCKSPLIKDNWKPSWQAEGREPHFTGNGKSPIVTFGTKKYLWGNMPAIDVLQVEANEGVDFSGTLNILFAASGDPRNIVKTIGSIPKTCSSKISITINDIDYDIVARNVIMFLTALNVQDVEKAADCMLHVWYSAKLTQDHMSLLRQSVRKLVDEVCVKIAEKPLDTIHEETWHFDSGSLRLMLSKRQWTQLLQYFDVPKGLTTERADHMRRAVTLAPERRDYRDRDTYKKQNGHRLSPIKFRSDGILLPFGCSQTLFTVPNPTMFMTEEWPMMDSSHPLDGWDYRTILNTAYGKADNDLCGKLHTLVGKVLRAFCTRIKTAPVDFKLLNVDAYDLRTQLKDDRFDRIEISNICDLWCLGPARAVGQLSGLLQTPAINPHATLVTLFMNAIAEEMSQTEEEQDADYEFTKAIKYIRPTPMSEGSMDPRLLMAMEARSMFRACDKYFNRYMKTQMFEAIEHRFGVQIKNRNTIIEKWPTRLKKKAGEKGAEDEFWTLLESGSMGMERYVEWKKTMEST